MANSIVKLTLESNDYERKLRDAKKQWESFTKSLGVNLSKFTAVGVAATAVTGAIKVFGDTIKSNGAKMKEWESTVKSAQSVYEGFLTSLNNGDISGFLSRIGSIISATKDATDALRDLELYNAFNKDKIDKASNAYSAAQTAYRKNPSAMNGAYLFQANKQVMKELEELRTRTESTLKEELGKIAAQKLPEHLRNTFVNDFLKDPYGTITNAQGIYKTEISGNKQYYKGDLVSNPPGNNGVYKINIGNGRWRNMTAGEQEEFELKRAYTQINEEQLKSLETLRDKIQNVNNQIDRQENTYTRDTTEKVSVGSRSVGAALRGSKKKTGNDFPEGSLGYYIALVRGLRDQQQYVTNGIQYQELEKDIAKYNYNITGIKYGKLDATGLGMNLSLANMGVVMPTREDIIKRGQRQIEGYQGYKGKQQMTNEEKLALMASGISQMTGGIGSIAGGIEQLGIELPKGLKEIVNTLGGIATIIGGISSTVTAVGVLSAIPFLANGGVVHAAGGVFVPGHSYSGDRVPAMLNSGELVLNRAQQGNLASQLSGGALGNLNLTARVQGSDLILAIDNTNKSAGKGKMMTMRFNHNG